MFKLSAFVPPYIIKIIYFSLFYSHLIYGITVWGGCRVSNINKNIKLHKRAISLCANNHSRNSLFQYSSVYSFFTLIRFQKNIHHHHSQYFTDKILALFPDHSHPRQQKYLGPHWDNMRSHCWYTVGTHDWDNVKIYNFFPRFPILAYNRVTILGQHRAPTLGHNWL